MQRKINEHEKGKDKATGSSIGKALRHSPSYSLVWLLHTHPEFAWQA